MRDKCNAVEPITCVFYTVSISCPGATSSETLSRVYMLQLMTTLLLNKPLFVI